MNNKRVYLVYKVTNKFDGKIYIGCHSTLNKSDRYMGSGVEIKEALKKYGRKSFVKEILFEFETKDEMLEKERELVTKEFCMREDTYNRIEGGGVYLSLGMVNVKDNDGNTMKVYKDDPRYLSGELVGVTAGTIMVKDKNGNCFRVKKGDPRYLSGELVSNMKGIIIVKDKKNNTFYVDKNDLRYLSGELVHTSKGLTQHENSSWAGKNHSEETKQKMSEKASQRTGEKNSQFGTCWITNGEENKKIKKEELSLWKSKGFHKGRKIENKKI